MFLNTKETEIFEITQWLLVTSCTNNPCKMKLCEPRESSPFGLGMHYTGKISLCNRFFSNYTLLKARGNSVSFCEYMPAGKGEGADWASVCRISDCGLGNGKSVLNQLILQIPLLCEFFCLPGNVPRTFYFVNLKSVFFLLLKSSFAGEHSQASSGLSRYCWWHPLLFEWQFQGTHRESVQ